MRDHKVIDPLQIIIDQFLKSFLQEIWGWGLLCFYCYNL